MGERPDHFGSLEATAAGYASVTPFLDDELAVLPDLLLTRWATTAVISAWRVGRYPENAEYITGWDAGVWTMLDAYRDMGLAEYQRKIREAMGAATRPDRPSPSRAARSRSSSNVAGVCSDRRSPLSPTIVRCTSCAVVARGSTTRKGARSSTATTTSPSSDTRIRTWWRRSPARRRRSTRTRATSTGRRWSSPSG